MTTKIDELDTGALTAYLTQQVPGFAGPITAEKFDGGQSNPTFKITAASGEYVLRRQPPGKLLPSAHAVDRSEERRVGKECRWRGGACHAREEKAGKW